MIAMSDVTHGAEDQASHVRHHARKRGMRDVSDANILMKSSRYEADGIHHRVSSRAIKTTAAVVVDFG